jgi:hypothetical protein
VEGKRSEGRRRECGVWRGKRSEGKEERVWRGKRSEGRGECGGGRGGQGNVSYGSLTDSSNPQFVQIKSMTALHKFVEKSQLTVGFGGTLSYNHQDWVRFRMVRAAIRAGSGSGW